MILKEFLESTGTDKNLSELILFLCEEVKTIKKGFVLTGANYPHDKKTTNPFGEEQMPLDVYADRVLIDGLSKNRLVRYIATEEQHSVIEVADPKNDFGVVIDPLDGSSLINVNLCIGTIIGVYPSHVLEKGSRMIAALYILYGPLTTMTLTTGHGVHEFLLDDAGHFILRHRDLKIPEGKIYSPGALRRDYTAPHAKWIGHLENEGYKLRFSGCFVADVHQILHKGGVFTYPGFRGKDGGKLRLLYEANPMGMIIHEAGGAVSNGSGDILKIKPHAIDQVTPVYIGGKKEIALIEKFMHEA